jgi:hypothetical protein
MVEAVGEQKIRVEILRDQITGKMVVVVVAQVDVAQI